MKRALILASLLFNVMIFSPVAAQGAFEVCADPTLGTSEVCQDAREGAREGNENPVIRILRNVIQILAFVIGVASIIVIVIAGLRFIISGGNPDATRQARNIIIYALVGIAIAIFAQTIVVLVLNRILE